MSKEELVDAYLDGRISRRTFVRRLAAAGVSLGAALTYAAALASESQADAKNDKGGGGPPGDDDEEDRRLYGGSTNLRVPFRRTVTNPCNGERVRIEGMVLFVVKVTINKAGRFSLNLHVNYSNVTGVGLETDDQYRGGGTSKITENGQIGGLYPVTFSSREMLTLAGRARNKFRITTHIHYTIDANGHVHAVFGKIDEVDCLG